MPGHTGLIEEIVNFEKVELDDDEKALILKIMNEDEFRNIIDQLKKFGKYPTLEDSEVKAQKLEKMKMIQQKQSRFFKGIHNYKLTTFGLFYIFSQMSTYPPNLLLRYQDNIILKELLFNIIEPETVRNCTARFYSILTQYLKDACKMIANTISSLKYTTIEEDRKNMLTSLESDLDWYAKSLGFKVTILYSETNLLNLGSSIGKDNIIVTLYELENKMKYTLSKDKRFTGFINIINKEFTEGYKEMVISN